jgi:hypothetical protein
MLSRTEVTAPLTSRQPRRLQPMPEATPTAPAPAPARPRTRRPAAPVASAPPPRSRGGGIRPWLALLAVLALFAGGLAAYQAAGGAAKKTVQLREPVSGRVDRAVEELKGLIEENTR